MMEGVNLRYIVSTVVNVTTYTQYNNMAIKRKEKFLNEISFFSWEVVEHCLAYTRPCAQFQHTKKRKKQTQKEKLIKKQDYN
jgi:hypothetical protein